MSILTKYTLRTLKENKSRTIVTIVGIILSVAMLTAVSLLVSSSRSYMEKSVIQTHGYWHGVITAADGRVTELMAENRDIEDIYITRNMGYVRNYNGVDHPRNMGYYNVTAADNKFFENMPVYLIDGRLPENGDEIILPETFYAGTEKTLALTGDKIALTVGEIPRDDDQFIGEADSPSGFEPFTKTYTVVGVYQRNYNLLSYSGAGNILFAGYEDNDFPLNIYYTTKEIKDTYSIMDIYTAPPYNCGGLLNTSLLYLNGITFTNRYITALYMMAAVLVAIIVFASISLIYNAFSISIGDRMKYFGLLSSIGATRKQLIKAVLTEAGILSLIGIPLGVLAGFAGIGITLKLSQNLFEVGFEKIVYAGAYGITFELEASPLFIALAIAVAIITVLVSAYIPARKSLSYSAIDAIRQSRRIAPEKKEIKLPGFMEKALGFEGMVAVRNFIRSRHRYRATVVSLFMSVVLFISAYSFCDLLEQSIKGVVNNVDYDVCYMPFLDPDSGLTHRDIEKDIAGLENVTATSFQRFTVYDLTIPLEYIDRDIWGRNNRDGTINRNTTVVFVKEEIFDSWLAENKLEKFTADGRFIGYTPNIFQIVVAENEGYLQRKVFKDSRLEKGIPLTVEQPIVVKKRENMPYGLLQYSVSDNIILPESAAPDYVFGTGGWEILVSSENPAQTTDDINEYIRSTSLNPDGQYVANYYQDYRNNRAILSIMKIFIAGFVTLIACIATANAFNSVSTNILLRRREFAIFTSTGMTNRKIKLMAAYECIIRGALALIFGLPAGTVVAHLINEILDYGYVILYTFPYECLLISRVMVFIVVLSTMLYAVRKVEKQNLMETLKNENI